MPRLNAGKGTYTTLYNFLWRNYDFFGAKTLSTAEGSTKGGKSYETTSRYKMFFANTKRVLKGHAKVS